MSSPPARLCKGKLMQEYLRMELERMAARPSVAAWLEQGAREKPRIADARLFTAKILKARDADRR